VTSKRFFLTEILLSFGCPPGYRMPMTSVLAPVHMVIRAFFVLLRAVFSHGKRSTPLARRPIPHADLPLLRRAL
jgi:hypothetical protein